MNKNKVLEFFKHARTNDELARQVMGAEQPEQVARLAVQHGFELRAEEIAGVIADLKSKLSPQELEDSELEAVAGGRAAAAGTAYFVGTGNNSASVTSVPCEIDKLGGLKTWTATQNITCD